MKIATWNVNSLRVRLPHLLQWLAQAQPDLIGLQETKLNDDQFPHAEFTQAGYQVIFAGQKTYNGVAIVARAVPPLSDIETQLPALTEDPQRRLITASYGDLRVINVYVPNGAEVDSDKYHYKLRWLAALHAYLQQQLQRYPKLVVMGDFNIAPEDRDVHDPKAWEGSVLVSPAEREAFTGLLALGLQDSYRLFDQPAGGFSWWDYRAAGFVRNHGLRIDHLLVSAALVPHCHAVRIDTAPRGWERPSDHTPVLAEFV
ncbi:MAG: exodeoxyribonuclease III [Gammaproteobacteria bacterium]|nr:exodeoxyribonuclease III [Gammaproteobacteria bacterium]